MNGKDLLESMGYVDEKYIQQAAAPMRRRLIPHWRALAAAAACLAVAILGIRALLPTKQENFAMMQRSEAHDQAETNGRGPETADMESDIAPMIAATSAGTIEASSMPDARSNAANSGTVEMVVRVLRQEADALVCVVTDPGTGSYAQDSEIRIALPDAGIALADSTSGAQEKAAAPAAGTGAATPAAVPAETTQEAITEETTPETTQETAEASVANQAMYFRVTYLPEEDGLIHPLSMTALESEG